MPLFIATTFGKIIKTSDNRVIKSGQSVMFFSENGIHSRMRRSEFIGAYDTQAKAMESYKQYARDLSASDFDEHGY